LFFENFHPFIGLDIHSLQANGFLGANNFENIYFLCALKVEKYAVKTRKYFLRKYQ
jgi:hypothetical protein